MRKSRANWRGTFRTLVKRLDVDSYIEVVDDRQENRRYKMQAILKEEGLVEREDVLLVRHRKEGDKKIWRVFRLGGAKVESSSLEESGSVSEVSRQVDLNKEI